VAIDALKNLAGSMDRSIRAARDAWCADPVCQAFIAGICADTADDAPRLILCDWLEDNGQPERAEFIRLGLEMARLGDECSRAKAFRQVWPDQKPHPCGDCAYCDLLRRTEALVDRVHHTSSIQDWRSHSMYWGKRKEAIEQLSKEPYCFFRRGFVAAVTLPLATFMETAGELFRHNPIEEVRLSDRSPSGYPASSGMDNRAVPVRWFMGGDDAEAVLPTVIYRLLTTGTANEAGAFRTYDTREEAEADAVAACVSFGRTQAAIAGD
jgi:uncharacterized protein (TIGR02996 family)